MRMHMPNDEMIVTSVGPYPLKSRRPGLPQTVRDCRIARFTAHRDGGEIGKLIFRQVSGMTEGGRPGIGDFILTPGIGQWFAGIIASRRSRNRVAPLRRHSKISRHRRVKLKEAN